MASPLRITSSKNPRLTNGVRLRDSKHRRSQKLFIIDGAKTIDIALRAGVKLRELFVAEESHDTMEWVVQNRVSYEDVYLLSPDLMGKLNYGEQTHDCIAVAKFFDTSLETLLARVETSTVTRGGRSNLFLVIDRIEKPGNLGAILRSADAAGVDAVLLSDPICDLFNPNAIRSSLGAVFTLPIGIGSMEKLSDWLRCNDITIYTARVEGAEDYSQAIYAERAALVVGNEALGLGDRWSGKEFRPVRIPMRGWLDSLNASVSTAVVLFEMVRQKSSLKHD